MSRITITREMSQTLEAIKATGKTPWAIVQDDTFAGVFASRGEARDAKAAGNFAGKIDKADEYQILVKADAPVAQVEAVQAKTTATADKTRRPAVEVTHESTTERPCKSVWHIADKMKIEQPNAKRSEILAKCVASGIAYYTARTQYQQWLGVQKEMAAREANQQAK